MQEDGLNSLTVEEYLTNYDNYVANKRAPSGNVAQAEYKQVAKLVTAEELLEMNPNLTIDEATQMATDMYKNSAALHNPDQITGGNPTQIHALGGKRENSALGSLWRHKRAEKLHDQIVKLAENMSLEEMKNTYLNVRLNIR